MPVLAGVWPRSDLGEDEAMRLAVEETHTARAEKRAARGLDTNVPTCSTCATDCLS